MRHIYTHTYIHVNLDIDIYRHKDIHIYTRERERERKRDRDGLEGVDSLKKASRSQHQLPLRRVLVEDLIAVSIQYLRVHLFDQFVFTGPSIPPICTRC